MWITLLEIILLIQIGNLSLIYQKRKTMKILIETLKEQHKLNSEICSNQYKKINTYLKKQAFKKLNDARKGYNELWEKCNKMEDYLKNNGVNYWTNYESQTIENPNIY